VSSLSIASAIFLFCLEIPDCFITGAESVSFPSTTRPEGRGGRGRSAARAPRDFPQIRDAVRELLGVRMDALARKFHQTHDVAVSDEIYRLSRELIKFDEPWVFRAK
jgi:hypothetical protein